jgi:hypothetical protein
LLLSFWFSAGHFLRWFISKDGFRIPARRPGQAYPHRHIANQLDPEASGPAERTYPSFGIYHQLSIFDQQHPEVSGPG